MMLFRDPQNQGMAAGEQGIRKHLRIGIMQAGAVRVIKVRRLKSAAVNAVFDSSGIGSGSQEKTDCTA